MAPACGDARVATSLAGLADSAGRHSAEGRAYRDRRGPHPNALGFLATPSLAPASRATIVIPRSPQPPSRNRSSAAIRVEHARDPRGRWTGRMRGLGGPWITGASASQIPNPKCNICNRRHLRCASPSASGCKMQRDPYPMREGPGAPLENDLPPVLTKSLLQRCLLSTLFCELHTDTRPSQKLLFCNGNFLYLCPFPIKKSPRSENTSWYF
jgi:hypothetical protein